MHNFRRVHCHAIVVFQYGMDASLLQKLKGDIHELVKCFYENLSSLPRRKSQDNRRGKRLKKIHEDEDKKAASKHVNNKKYAPVSSASSSTCKRGYQVSFQSNSTPEMDRLEARSKAAKKLTSNIGSTPEMNRLEARSKAIKLSGPPRPDSDSKRVALAANKDSNTKLSISAPTQNLLAKSSPKKVTKIFSTLRADQTNSNHTDPSSAENTQNTNSTGSLKGVRRKLKRNSFVPTSQPENKLSKC